MVVLRLDSFRHTRRRLLIFGLFTFLIFLFFVHASLKHGLSSIKIPVGRFWACDPDPPSKWEELYQWEDNLPQHNPDLPFPEGKTGRYVYFANQIQHLGWNNQLNEVLMNTYLAYKSNRTYTFQDYLWKWEYYPWINHHKRPLMPRTPLNALISGPSAGGPWDSSDPFPRSISDRFFDKVCPPNERKIINTREIKPSIYWEQNGRVIFETWQKLLLDAPERCIEIQPADRSEDGFPQIFDLWFWGSGKSNDLWDEYKDSAVSRLLKTSPVVESAVARNVYLLSPRGPKPPLRVSSDPFDRMLALHIRRGDFKEACLSLARWNSTFYGWNLLSFLPDKFQHPSGWDEDRNETIATYMEHCYPTEDFIMNKIRTSRKAYIDAAKPGEVRYLDTVYMLTNDRTERIEKLKGMLYDDGWNHVVTTSQLELDSQQKDVGMAVDMDLARRAAVFIGNGWSSLTSNVVHRRLVDRKEPISIRFF